MIYNEDQYEALRKQLARAEDVLLRHGFEDRGGETWKPPLGDIDKARLKLDLQDAHARIAELEAELTRWVARMKLLEERQAKAVRLLEGHT